jgi:hypothetical protein
MTFSGGGIRTSLHTPVANGCDSSHVYWTAVKAANKTDTFAVFPMPGKGSSLGRRYFAHSSITSYALMTVGRIRSRRAAGTDEPSLLDRHIYSTT